MECKLIITNGLFRAEVHFRGGSIMDKTRRPASYATSRFIEQDIIENSAEFKSGKIVLLHKMEVPDDAEELARKASLEKKSTVAKPAATVATPAVTEETSATDTAEPTNVLTSSVETEETSASDAGETNKGDEDEGTSGSNDGVQTIEVACKADAVEWLKEHYPEKGYNGNNLRGKEAFAAACKEAGVEFIIANA